MTALHRHIPERKDGKMKRLAARILAAAMLLAAVGGLLTGCASGKWQGEWNRTGDATYSRAVLEIFNVSRKGFSFDLTLYNGNVVGELEDCQALFLDRACTKAVYDVDNTYASITFEMNEKGELEVLYMGGTTASNYVIEAELFDFSAPAYITGNFVRGDTTYLNSSFAAIGMLSDDADEMVHHIMPQEMYDRCLDCFQFWEQGLTKTGSAHDDDIGGFVYYGWNQMQDKAAVIIIFDDDSVAVVLSRTDGSLVYYCDNHIYGTGEVYPLPIKVWMEEYYEAQKKN